MNRFVLLFISFLLYSNIIIAQTRVIDATDRYPIAAASIFDASGNIIGLTLIDGDFPDVPESAYPITIRCIGYEQLTIERPNNKIWEMIPTVYELDEIEVIPAKRNILKQSFYVREYFSMHNNDDTVNFFLEHMTVRFLPTSKEAKFSGSSSLRILNSRCYSHYKIGDLDSVSLNYQLKFPTMLSLCSLDNSPIDATQSFKQQSGSNKLYQKSGKSGMSIVQKQNEQTFTIVEDLLAGQKDHSMSPWGLSLIGMGIDVNHFLMTQTYRANNKYTYQPKDLMEASFVMEADGKGKLIRKIFKSDQPIILRSMIEIYLVDNEYITSEEAKQEYKDKDIGLSFTVPSTVPSLNAATQRLVIRAKNKAKKGK